MTLDISAIRQRCSKGRFKEFEHETVLALCDEIGRLRKYAHHLPDCQFQQAKVEFGANYFHGPTITASKNPDWKCSCGWAEIMPPASTPSESS